MLKYTLVRVLTAYHVYDSSKIDETEKKREGGRQRERREEKEITLMTKS